MNIVSSNYRYKRHRKGKQSVEIPQRIVSTKQPKLTRAISAQACVSARARDPFRLPMLTRPDAEIPNHTNRMTVPKRVIVESQFPIDLNLKSQSVSMR